jgi:hypothetical protein
MNTYQITFKTRERGGYAEVQASNVHTAVKRILADLEPYRKPVPLGKNQRMTITIDRV